MLIGYIRVSKSDGTQALDLQHDALLAAGVAPERNYTDRASGRKDDRPGLATCLRALQAGDTLVVWKLDRLGYGQKQVPVFTRIRERRGSSTWAGDHQK